MPLSTSCMYPLATVTLEWEGLDVFRQPTNDSIGAALGRGNRAKRREGARRKQLAPLWCVRVTLLTRLVVD